MHEKVEKRLFLIDGYGFVFRAFHSLPPLTNPAGQPVGAVYGFTNMLIKLKNRVRTTNAEEAYLVCVFDAGKATFRDEIYTEYKANRPAPPDDLIPQFPMVRDVAKALNIEAVELEGFEADDIIATYAKLAQEKGIHVTIVSSDKDLMQLVTEDVKMYDSLREKIIGIDQVKEKFGVAPDKVLDVLSLMGDSSDNVPGVPGVGPKTAADLINQFGSIDNIYANLDKITKKKLKENLENHKSDAYLSRQLVTLKNDVDVDKDISKYKIKDDDINILKPFLLQNGFKSLLARIEGSNSSAPISEKNNNLSLDGRGHTTTSISGSIGEGDTSRTPHPSPLPQGAMEFKTTEISSRAEFAAWLPPLNEARKLAIFPNNEAIFLAKSTHEQCLLKSISETIDHRPSAINKNQDDLFSTVGANDNKSFKAYFEVLKPYLESGSCNFIFYDLKNILKTHKDFSAPQAFDDVLIMNYSINGTVKEFKLPEENQAIEIFNVHEKFSNQIFSDKLNYIYYDVEKPLIETLLRMETAGIKVDKNILTQLSKEFGEKIKKLESEIYALAGEEFNIGSPKQLGEVLFEHMGIQGGKKSKSGGYTTDSDVLETLNEQGHSIAGKVLEWRGFSKLTNTYTIALAKEISPETARIHTTFRQASTTTGRLSSIDPNLQNIPIRTEEGRKIRKAFVAENGKTLVGIDYSQIELRLLAHIANIEVLKDAFKNNKDIHAITASQVFGVDVNKVDSEMRRRAKTINFGIIYGQSAFGLAAQLGIPRGEAKTLIDKYFAQYPGIRKYMEDTVIQAREQGYVSTLWGRRIYLPGIQDKNAAIRNFNERAAINAPLQGTAADIIKRAMILIDNELNRDEDMKMRRGEDKKNNSSSPHLITSSPPKARLLLQIHDELILEANENDAQQIADQCKKIMENVITLSVPIIADAKIGKNWGEVH